MDPHDVPTERVCLCCAHALTDDLGRLVCDRCERHIADGLAEVARLWKKLPGLLEKGTSSAAADEPRVHTSKVDAPLPGNPEVLNLIGGGVTGPLLKHEQAWRWELRTTLYPHLPLTPYRGDESRTLAGTLAFLREQLRWACQSYEGITGLESDLHDLLTQIREAVTGERRKRPTVLPVPCPLTPDGTQPCGGELAFDPTTKVISCRTCRGLIGYEHWAAIGLTGGLIVSDLSA